MFYGFECTYDTQINRRAESIKSKKSVSSRLNVGFRVATALHSTFVSPASSQLGLGMWPQIQIMKKSFQLSWCWWDVSFARPPEQPLVPVELWHRNMIQTNTTPGCYFLHWKRHLGQPLARRDVAHTTVKNSKILKQAEEILAPINSSDQSLFLSHSVCTCIVHSITIIITIVTAIPGYCLLSYILYAESSF